jgi:hypothetical protein
VTLSSLFIGGYARPEITYFEGIVEGFKDESLYFFWYVFIFSSSPDGFIRFMFITFWIVYLVSLRRFIVNCFWVGVDIDTIC